MEGVQDPPELRGIIPNAFQQIFDRVALAAEGVQFLVRASYLEIYNEEVRDLLAKDPKNRLDLKENVDSGVYVKDLTSFIARSRRPDAFMRLVSIRRGRGWFYFGFRAVSDHTVASREREQSAWVAAIA